MKSNNTKKTDANKSLFRVSSEPIINTQMNKPRMVENEKISSKQRRGMKKAPRGFSLMYHRRQNTKYDLPPTGTNYCDPYQPINHIMHHHTHQSITNTSHTSITHHAMDVKSYLFVFGTVRLYR